MPDVADKLTGQTAIVTGEKDVAPVAKILKTFAAEFKIAALKIGVVDKSILSTQEVEAMAELPSREVLLSQLLGLLLSPATRLVRLLNEPACVLRAIAQRESAKRKGNQRRQQHNRICRRRVACAARRVGCDTTKTNNCPARRLSA